MSGTPCRIIIEGNRLQAYARQMAAIAQGFLPEAQQAIAAAQSVCQLGTATYDGKEVMTDEQQARAPVIMNNFNNAAAAMDYNKPFGFHETAQARNLLSFVGKALNDLLADVLQNPS